MGETQRLREVFKKRTGQARSLALSTCVLMGLPALQLTAVAVVF